MVPTCSAPAAGSRGPLPAEPCVAPIVTSPGRRPRSGGWRSVPAASGIFSASAPPGNRPGRWRGAAAEPAGAAGARQDKAGSEQPSTERLCPAGALPPPPPANRACKRPGKAKKHFHSPWEEKNCYSPFTKIFLVFLPLAAAGS